MFHKSFSNNLNEVEIDDEVFEDHRISSSSGPYHMVGYAAAGSQQETFNEEALESIRDQTDPGRESLKGT